MFGAKALRQGELMSNTNSMSSDILSDCPAKHFMAGGFKKLGVWQFDCKLGILQV